MMLARSRDHKRFSDDVPLLPLFSLGVDLTPVQRNQAKVKQGLSRVVGAMVETRLRGSSNHLSTRVLALCRIPLLTLYLSLFLSGASVTSPAVVGPMAAAASLLRLQLLDAEGGKAAGRNRRERVTAGGG